MNDDIEIPLAGIAIIDQRNIIVHGKDYRQMYLELPQKVARGEIIAAVQKIKLDIAVGEYTFEVGSSTISVLEYEQRMYHNQEYVDLKTERMAVRPNVGSFAVHGKSEGDPMMLMFHGCCDLPVKVEVHLLKNN